MGYSFGVPLGFGTLKFKSRTRLRQEEREKLVPVWRFGQTFVIWRTRPDRAAPTFNAPKAQLPPILRRDRLAP